MSTHLDPITVTGIGLDEPAGLIDAHGRRRNDTRLSPYAADVSSAQLLSLLRDMIVLRRLDTEGVALQRQGQLGLWAPCQGQEAAQIGSARALKNDDVVFPSYRETGVMLARGAQPGDYVRMWRGEEGASYDPAVMHMAPLQIIIGAQTLHAVGYALGILHDGSDQVAVTYFGDGATSQGDVNEAMVFASSYRAPVVFICQNNHWAISEPVAVQSQHPIAGRAPGFGIPSMRVDGNDVLAVFAATRWALEQARGGSPAFLELVTYRMGPHTTADDPTRYRDPAELDYWRGKDPLARVEALLRAEGALTDEIAAGIAAEADEAAMQMRAACLGLETRGPLAVFDGVYAEPHTGIAEERADYERYLATLAEA
ncbi:pyruvate dehydrogenase (acetyl-transferring) E1 component subunit alpha [Microbacterium sp. Au-Mic1]|uniref:thiamine pyrophosphate-dependent enzyme n=1 Tax=Microbacterium sp. Au-Mic1 TaxID=2906457 RepID=UPI001E62F401|nr:thiamine pyrophosphate-dependent enzyme [Microbacterium sp. Au-Mic1]MCE4024739.1 pyruvate dehydrogenase (acetyl-transferring) E1 component subunit alpha [Microbacterium sp. Au-Mic1]